MRTLTNNEWVHEIYTSTTAGRKPALGTLGVGELAVNIADKLLWVGDAAGNPIALNDILPAYTVANKDQRLTVNAAGTAVEWSDPVPAGFVSGGEITDVTNDPALLAHTVPTVYTVKAGGGGVAHTNFNELSGLNVPDGSTLLWLTGGHWVWLDQVSALIQNILPAFTGVDAGKHLRINAGGTAVEWTALPPVVSRTIINDPTITPPQASVSATFLTEPTANRTVSGHDVVIYSWTGDHYLYTGAKGNPVTAAVDADFTKLSGGAASSHAGAHVVIQAPVAGVSQSITAAAAADVPLTLKGATGQTANLFGVGDSTGAHKVTVDKDANLHVTGTGQFDGNLSVGTKFNVTAADGSISAASGKFNVGSHGDVGAVNYRMISAGLPQAYMAVNATGGFLNSADAAGAGDQNVLVWVHGAETILYFNGHQKLRTTNNGIAVTGRVEAESYRMNAAGLSQAKMAVTATGGFLNSADAAGAGDQNALTWLHGAGTALYFNGHEKLITNNQGISVTGRVEAESYRMISAGLSQAYMAVSATGGFLNSTDAAGAGDENAIVWTHNGMTRLCYDGNPRLETTTDGITAKGAATLTSIKALSGTGGAAVFANSAASSFSLASTDGAGNYVQNILLHSHAADKTTTIYGGTTYTSKVTLNATSATIEATGGVVLNHGAVGMLQTTTSGVHTPESIGVDKNLHVRGISQFGNPATAINPAPTNIGAVFDVGHDSRYYFVSGNAAGSNIMVFANNTPDGRNIEFYRNGSYAGSITSTNTTTAYGTTSDYRLKENVEPIPNALSMINALNPVQYDFIDRHESYKIQGFLAHELQAHVPSSVTGQKDEVDADGKPIYQSVDSSHVVPLLVKGLQELKAIIDAQAARIAALEAKK